MHNYVKNFYRHKYKKKITRFNINMINLSLDELKQVAQSRNIGDYENKSKKDLIKALSKPKTKTKI